MKRRIFVLSLAWLLACAAPGYAQEEGGNPIKVTSTLHGDGSRTDTTRDIDNHVMETKTYNASKKLVQRCVFTLDDQGLATEGVMYNAKDVIVARMAYKYDALGQMSEQVNKAPNGSPLGKLVFTHDAKGRVTVQAFDAQGNPVNDDGSAAPTPSRKKSKTGSR